ncbi:MAG: glycosyltransferase, partial [Chloroflexi bacterium]|nr:glycosyltransferase [Chloroflexota bacterium]
MVREISGYLRSSGHNIAIVTNRYPRRLPRHDTIDGIPVTRLQFLYPQLAYLKAGRLDLWLAGFVYFPLTLLQLALILRAYKPDAVNLHYLGVPGFFVCILHRLFRFRLVVSLHGGDVDGEPHRSRFNCWLFRAVLARADAVTACSRALLDQALQLAPDIAPKARVIHNGVDVELFVTARPCPHPRPYFLAVGQLLRHKGFDDLIAAYARAQADLAGFDVLIAGDGPERQSLEAQAVAEKLNGRVHFLGAVTREQVASLMRGAAVIVIPSRREPFGIVALEAMASGRPIIATPVGGLVEALEG